MFWFAKAFARGFLFLLVALLLLGSLFYVSFERVVSSDFVWSLLQRTAQRSDVELRSGRIRVVTPGVVEFQDLALAGAGEANAFFHTPVLSLSIFAGGNPWLSVRADRATIDLRWVPASPPSADAPNSFAGMIPEWMRYLHVAFSDSQILLDPAGDPAAVGGGPSSEPQPPLIVGPVSLLWDPLRAGGSQGAAAAVISLSNPQFSLEFGDVRIEGGVDLELALEDPGEDVWRLRGQLVGVDVQTSAARVDGLEGALAGEIVSPYLLLAEEELSSQPLTSGQITGLGFNWRHVGIDWKTKELSASFHSVDGLRLSVAGLGFQDDAFSRVGEGLDMNLEASWPQQTTEGSWSSSVRGGIPTGGLLVDRFYVDLADAPVSMRGLVSVDAGRLGLQDARVQLGELLSVEELAASSRIDEPSQNWNGAGRLNVSRAGQAFDLFVREPLGDTFPVFAATTVDGSFQVAARVAVAAGAITKAQFELTTKDLSLETEDVFAVEGLRGQFPVSLIGEPLRLAKPTQLSFRSLEFLGHRTGASEVVFDAAGATLTAKDPLVLAVAGGTVTFADMTITTSLKPPRRAAAAVTFSDLSLAALAESFDVVEVPGTLSGVLSSVSLRGDEISSQGTLRVDVFGGHIDLLDPCASGLYGRVPEYRLASAEIVDLRLDRLSESLPLGGVSGVLVGSVTDLAFADGQPVRMDASLRTRAVRGVPQTISVTAISQISIIGGSGGDPFSRGILSFFDEYRYAKMGLHCSLENDRFILRGVEERDGKDYLVVGSMIPPSVNVISHSHVISFREMVRRLGSAVSTEPEFEAP